MRTSSQCRRLLSLALVEGALGCSDPPPSEAPLATVQDRLRLALTRAANVNVIVNLRDPTPTWLVRDREHHRRTLSQLRASVLASGHEGFVPTRQFEHVPAIAGRISRSALEVLARDPNVSFIQLDDIGHGALAVSVPAIGADTARSAFHVTGAGVRVAVLDTGANSGHPDLETSIASTQHCFTQHACPPDNSSEGASAEDDHGHGSHVSGIITSDGSVAAVGFAPGADVVPVKVNDRNNAGRVSDWVAGLDWVFSNLSTLGVKLVNLSISSDFMYGSQGECDAGQPALARSVKNLVDAGVTLFAASGNKGSATELSAPACNSGVIAVGATYKSNQGRQPMSGTYRDQWGDSFGSCADQTTAFDQVACFTNSGVRLDLVAPGAVITSDTLGTRTDQYRGTSQASPTAAGVAALMLECNPELTPAEVKEILIGTSEMVTDPKNGRSYPSIRANAAVERACSASASSGAGGAPDSGGASATGGVDASGGTGETTGGRTAAAGSGGATAAGGRGQTTGGRTAAAGTGGATAAGGTSQTTGGRTETGGIRETTNGATATGGSAAGGTVHGTGGAPSASGASAAGSVTGPGSTIEAGGSRPETGGSVTTGSGGDQNTTTGGRSHSAGGGSAYAPTSSASNEAGCSCRIAGGTEQPTLAVVALGLLGFMSTRRRGHRDSPGRATVGAQAYSVCRLKGTRANNNPGG
jgi:MYXO-CTERM domain-containing protein